VKVTVKCNAKLNLFLKILGKRPDGYHDLVSVMQSVDLADKLEIEETGSDGIEVVCDNPDIPTDNTNLVWKAAEILAEKAGRRAGGVRFTINKNIPPMSGLAGGSADCAGALIGLKILWGLEIDELELIKLGAMLGSDVPFCLMGGTMLVSGRGEVLEPLPLGIAESSSTECCFLLVLPEINVSSRGAYEVLDVDRIKRPIEAVSVSEVLNVVREAWVAKIFHGDIPVMLHNDFEAPVYNVWEDLRQVYLNLRNQIGHAILSGSGSCIFSCLPGYQEALDAQKAYTPVADETNFIARPVSRGVEIL